MASEKYVEALGQLLSVWGADRMLPSKLGGAGKNHELWSRVIRAAGKDLTSEHDHHFFVRTLSQQKSARCEGYIVDLVTRREEHQDNVAVNSADDILHCEIAPVVRAINKRDISAVELTASAIDRLREVGCNTNVAIYIDDEMSLRKAESIDRRIKGNADLGALAGIPMAHKALLCSRELRCSDGISEKLLDRCPSSSTALRLLEESGTISIGQLNLTEMALDATGLNANLGYCRNPWDSESLSGGSSSGSGVAIATRSVFGSLGTDTAGSIRTPAALCGVTGLKPTYGRVSCHGVLPVSNSHDHVGPIAKSARDCRLILQAILERECSENTSPINSLQTIVHPVGRKIRIGVPHKYFHSTVCDELRENLEQSLSVLNDLGYEICDVKEFDYDELNALSSFIIRTEALSNYLFVADRMKVPPSERILNVLQQGLGIPFSVYDCAMRLRGLRLSQFLCEIMDGIDLIHVPTTRIITPLIDKCLNEHEVFEECSLELTRFTRPFNFLGLPALVLPCGLHRGMSGKELPQAFQLVGRPYSESLLFEVGIAFQQATAWHMKIPSSMGTKNPGA